MNNIGSPPLPSQEILHLSIQSSCLKNAGPRNKKEILNNVNWDNVSKLSQTGEIRTTLESYRLLYL